MNHKGHTTDALDKRFAYFYAQGGHPIHYPEQAFLKKPLVCQPLDDEWQQRINENCWWATGYTGPQEGPPEDMELVRKLLTFGGFEACVEYMEPDAKPLLQRGQLWYGDRVQRMKGEPCQCHRNSCNLWKANRGQHEVAIATGYALTKDGMWRQHSWLMLRRFRSVRVIETTTSRIAYFGYVMTVEEAEEFCSEN